jgi:hypothetical protein
VVAFVACESLRCAINPYEASSADDPGHEAVSADDPGHEDESAGIRVGAFGWSLAFFYPVIAASSVYFYWIVAWFLLGHRPRPSVDDPKEVGWAIGYVYNIVLILVVLLPPMSVGGLALAILCPFRSLRERRFGRVMIVVANALLAFSVWKLATLDPGQVFEWFID